MDTTTIHPTPTPRILYITPLGTFPTWEDAATACERCDLDPCTCIDIRKEG